MDDNKKICRRLLRTVTETGPAWRTVLEGLAESHGAGDSDALVTGMIKRGELIKYGDRRGTRWGVPGWKGL